MVEPILNGIICGMAGFLIASVLTRDGEILDWYPKLVKWILRVQNKDPFSYTKVEFLIIKLAFGCAKCLSGQIAFWFFFFHTDLAHTAVTVVVGIFSGFALDRHYE